MKTRKKGNPEISGTVEQSARDFRNKTYKIETRGRQNQTYKKHQWTKGLVTEKKSTQIGQ